MRDDGHERRRRNRPPRERQRDIRHLRRTPYRAIEPELAFVVDTGERVAGYVITTGNTRLFARMGIVEHVDPNMIVVEANVRTEANLLREFVASIKQNGA